MPAPLALPSAFSPPAAAPLDRIQRVHLALAVLALDPGAMGGLWLRARIGPARAAVQAWLADALPLPNRRLHPSIDDAALYGGTDLAASLAAGAHRRSTGLFDAAAALVLPMAERTPPALAARLALHLDAGTSCLIALDEGDIGGDDGAPEALPASLAERLGLFLDLSDMSLEDAQALTPPADLLASLPAARTALARLRAQGLPAAACTRLAQLAADLGIASLRAPWLAGQAALAIAALRALPAVDAACLQQAAELCLAHRAAPAADDAEQTTAPAPQSPSPPPPETEAPPQLDQIPQDIVLDAVRAALPADLLDRLAQARALRAARAGAGTGARIKGNHRGRPLPPRPGRLGQGQRVDILATLRAAAPMQALRRARPSAAGAGPQRLAIRPSDLRLKRYQHSSDRVLIFAVDASGSSAFARLAEAKGAVELLLARAYARRDHVALVAFRGAGAQVLLPPTRALVAAKRRLAEMSGGGGTPLAAALAASLQLALQARARGMTPTLALLTDGRGNIALDGAPGREAAQRDSHAMAQRIAATGIPSLAIDIAQRPTGQGSGQMADLARAMGARYVPMPRADAQRLSDVLQAGLG